MNKVTFPALKATNRLPSPPAVAMRILKLVASDDTTLDELAEVISADPALAAKILKYLHSPLIGLGFHGTTLAEAVSRIGTRGAQLLALSFSLVSQKHHQSCPSFDFNRFWSMSLARAVAAKRLAAIKRQWHPEEAFIAGLVFRIGQLVLATALPPEYEPVLRGAAGDDAALLERERGALGIDHLKVGYQLLLDWKLPKTVWGAMETFALTQRASSEESDDNPAIALLQFADEMAAFMVRNKQQQALSMDTLIARAEELAALDHDSFRPLLERISHDWNTYGDLFSIITAKLPDLDALELEAEEHRDALRLAAELEVLNLRKENQQLSHLASRDRLTGLLNRGAFEDALAASIAAAADQHASLALLMIDVDRFKSINDDHGHPVGDEVLRHITRLFHTCTKGPAEVFRYGGDEFIMLVPTADEVNVETLVGALRQAIANCPHQAGEKRISLTISIGVGWACWPDQAMTPTSLVQAADQQLYEAKQAGRNTHRSTQCNAQAGRE